MRKTFFVFLISLAMFQVLGQGNYYIYIQSADHKPFYVRSGSRIFYSSGNGYLVIDDLNSSTYDLIVGFEDWANTEWHFNCTINDEDKAFILKNNNGKKAELSSLKNDEKQSGKKVEVKTEKANTVMGKKATGIVSEDPFSTMLAEVVDDPTIRQQPVIIPRPGDSLKLVRTAKPDSTTLTVVNPVKAKEAIVTNISTDSQSVAKTTTVIPKTLTDNKVAVASGQNLADSSIAIAPFAKAEDKKPETLPKVHDKKNERRKIVATLAVAENMNGKYKASEKQPDAIPLKIPGSVVSVIKTSVSPKNREQIRQDLVVQTPDSTSVAVVEKLKQKETSADKTTTSIRDPSSSSQLINAAFEEAEKKKQSGNSSGTEKTAIILGNSASIKKTLQRRSREGTELIYVDEMDDGSKDIIRILIPADN